MTSPIPFLNPCKCPAGPCEHFPFNIDGFMLKIRQGTSGLGREKEVQTLIHYAEARQRPAEKPEWMNHLSNFSKEDHLNLMKELAEARKKSGCNCGGNKKSTLS